VVSVHHLTQTAAARPTKVAQALADQAARLERLVGQFELGR
jgi:hypothetical protein